MALKHVVCSVGIALLTTYQMAETAMLYSIETLGFYGPLYTRDDGYQYSETQQLNQAGQVSGYSERYWESYYYGRTAWLHDGSTTINIGLTGSGYTKSGNYQYSSPRQLNEAGQVLGYAKRYSGDKELGQSVWLYDNSITLNVGLNDSEHTRDDGYQWSYADEMNEAGQVIGDSQSFTGSTIMGPSAWLYDGNETLIIGLTDSEHTRSDGYQSNNADELNESGQVTGDAARYNGDTFFGLSAWLFDNGSTINISPTDSEFIRDDDYRYSDTVRLNEAGQVVGHAYRYDGGSSYLGQSVWLYDGSNTVIIGLIGSDYTSYDGIQHNQAKALNDSGYVLGIARHYSGDLYLGESVWLYNISSTINIGLTDSEHTDEGGYQYSYAQRLNKAGHVAGRASRYDGSIPLGISAWLYDGYDTLNIGLTDSEHTRDDGYQRNDSVSLNEAGQVVGYADRYNGSTYSGRSVWLYNGSITFNVGLTDSEHTSDSGFQDGYMRNFNETGQVTGGAHRYSGDTFLGASAWFYDSATNKTYYKDFSIRPSDGNALSAPQYLNDDGLMLGYYVLYDENDSTTLGYRAFGFTVEDGFFQLGMQVEGELESFDWDHLAKAYYANELGQIIGHGMLDDQADGQSAYLLTPTESDDEDEEDEPPYSQGDTDDDDYPGPGWSRPSHRGGNDDDDHPGRGRGGPAQTNRDV